MPVFEVDDPNNQVEQRVLFPSQGMYTAELQDVKVRKNKRRDGTGDIVFLDWYFEISESPDLPELVGRKVKGSSFAVLATKGGVLDLRFWKWSSNMLGQELGPGVKIDTDELIGLQTKIVVEVKPDRNDPSKSWPEISHVLNDEGVDVTDFNNGSDAPPF